MKHIKSSIAAVTQSISLEELRRRLGHLRRQLKKCVEYEGKINMMSHLLQYIF